MNKTIEGYLSKLEFGELQAIDNIGILPLFADIDYKLEYLTLKDALEAGTLDIKEVHSDGSVPELKAINKGKTKVLLLDGEELAGAKQNRILNTTILLKEESVTIIPVSCTEQGRWSSVSEEFHNSGIHASPSLRRKQAYAVAESLGQRAEYSADQGAVWDHVEQQHLYSKIDNRRSPTRAMRNVYEARKKNLDEYFKSFEHVPHQKGIMVFINGKAVGFDSIPLESAYRTLHEKLVKSYIMDAILEKKKDDDKPSVKKAGAFLEKVTASDEKKYRSMGCGSDYRYTGIGITGSSLKYDKEVVHMGFFKFIRSDRHGRMASYRRRRGFRS